MGVPLHRFREEVINVELSALLCERGFVAVPETIRSRKLPDVLVNLGGLKLVIEGRASARSAALFDDAKARVVEGTADISMAVVYPPGLEEAESVDDLRQNIDASRFDAAVFYFDRQGIAQQTAGAASLDELAAVINAVVGVRVQNDLVREQVAKLQGMIGSVVERALVSNLFFNSDAVATRLREALGISDGEAE